MAVPSQPWSTMGHPGQLDFGSNFSPFTALYGVLHTTYGVQLTATQGDHRDAVSRPPIFTLLATSSTQLSLTLKRS